MRRRHRGDTATVEQAVRADVAHWWTLDADERERLLAAAEWLLAHKHWEAAGGLDLDDRMRAVIAAQAGLLVLELGTDHYREVSSIVVYPSGMVQSGARPGPVPGTVTEARVPLHGLSAGHRGPVLIAWDQAIAAARHPGRNHDVVLHEFAHKLDQLDGMMDGTPPVARGLRDRWVEVCQRAYDEMSLGVPHPPLRGYGATNPAEFFAVATEAFFGVPGLLRQAEPALYDVLRGFYAQDPATRTHRPPG
jgi:Mlc titration factor MtfA (ptsG expression regulator)